MAIRESFYFLAWRDILVRYKQTVIGRAWAVLRPLLTMKRRIATRHGLLVSIESIDGMKVSSVVLAGQTCKRFEAAQLRRQLIYPLA